jgi:hypothetical protein
VRQYRVFPLVIRETLTGETPAMGVDPREQTHYFPRSERDLKEFLRGKMCIDREIG